MKKLLRFIIPLIFIPIVFIIGYIFSVCLFGLFISFLTWDWSIISNNIFPWETKEINITIRSISGTFGIFGVISLWASSDISNYKEQMREEELE